MSKHLKHNNIFFNGEYRQIWRRLKTFFEQLLTKSYSLFKF